MKKGSVILAILISITLLYPQTTEAHRIYIDEVEGSNPLSSNKGLLVRYDDASVSTTATITAYDVEGKELFQDSVDQEGYYPLPSNPAIYRIVANDGMGHRAVWMRGEESSVIASIPLWVRTLTGLAVLSFVAALFYYRNEGRRVAEGSELEQA